MLSGKSLSDSLLAAQWITSAIKKEPAPEILKPVLIRFTIITPALKPLR